MNSDMRRISSGDESYDPLTSLPSLTVDKETGYALFAYDIGLSTNLEETERWITTGTEWRRLRHKSRARSI